MKKTLKVAAIVAIALLGGAHANSAKANIFPHTQVGECINGTRDVFSMGWFGNVRSYSSVNC